MLRAKGAEYEAHLLRNAAAALGPNGELARLASPGAVALHEVAVAQASPVPQVLYLQVSVLAVRLLIALESMRTFCKGSLQVLMATSALLLGSHDFFPAPNSVAWPFHFLPAC